MLLDDGVSLGQPESGALADRLGGEERIEDPAPDVLRDARAVVVELQGDHAQGVVVPASDDERPAAVGGEHRVLGVDDQVQQHLLHLVGVREDEGQSVGEGVEGRHVRHPLLVGPRGQRVAHDVVQVDEGAGGVALPGEGQQVPHDAGRPLRLAENRLDPALRLRRRRARGQPFGARQDGRQRVVQLVGDARDGLAQGRHLLRLHQLVRGVAAQGLEPPPLADVAHEGVEARRTGVAGGAQGGGDLDPHRAVVDPPQADQVAGDRPVAAQPRDEVGAGPFVEEPVGRERPHAGVGLVRVEPEHELQVGVGAQRLDIPVVEGADVDSLGDGLVEPREQLRRRPGGAARAHAGMMVGPCRVPSRGGRPDPDGFGRPRRKTRRTRGFRRGRPERQLPRGAGGVGVA